MKAFIVDGNHQYEALMKGIGFEITYNSEEADIALFTGGEDVSPILYDAKNHPFTFSNITRDRAEMMLFNTFLSRSIPMVGICRGGQFLNVMSGGAMYQDVTAHGRGHEITDLQTGEVVYVSSTHHQMIKPSEKGLVVAVSSHTSDREWYEGGIFKRDTSNTGIEVVYYEHANSLCFQPHPEFNAPEYVGMKRYFKSLVEKFLMKVEA